MAIIFAIKYDQNSHTWQPVEFSGDSYDEANKLYQSHYEECFVVASGDTEEILQCKRFTNCPDGYTKPAIALTEQQARDLSWQYALEATANDNYLRGKAEISVGRSHDLKLSKAILDAKPENWQKFTVKEENLSNGSWRRNEHRYASTYEVWKNEKTGSTAAWSHPAPWETSHRFLIDNFPEIWGMLDKKKFVPTPLKDAT